MKRTATLTSLFRELGRYLDGPRQQPAQPQSRTTQMYRSSERITKVSW